MNLICEVTINNYVRKIEVSKSRKETYYKKSEEKTLPKKYQIGILNGEYKFINIIKKGFLLVNKEGDLIIKNKKTAGTPKYKRINGQDLHTLTLQPYERSKIIKAIKEQMIPEVNKLEPIKLFPIRILCEIHNTFHDAELIKVNGDVKENVDWDVDNHSIFYTKVFSDVLCGSPYCKERGSKLEYQSKIIIPDDNRKYVTQHGSALFCPIENANNRKLIFKIYHDDRKIIKENSNY